MGSVSRESYTSSEVLRKARFYSVFAEALPYRSQQKSSVLLGFYLGSVGSVGGESWRVLESLENFDCEDNSRWRAVNLLGVPFNDL